MFIIWKKSEISEFLRNFFFILENQEFLWKFYRFREIFGILLLN